MINFYLAAAQMSSDEINEINNFSFDYIFEMIGDIFDSTIFVPTAVMEIFKYLPPAFLYLFFTSVVFIILGGLISVLLRIL